MGHDAGLGREAHAQFGLNLQEELVIQPSRPTGAFDFRNAQDQWQLAPFAPEHIIQRFFNGHRGHLGQLGETAPRLLQRHLVRHDPLAT